MMIDLRGSASRLAFVYLLVAGVLAAVLAAVSHAVAHPLSFNSTVTYSARQPEGDQHSIANWQGAPFDAANVGGSGLNTNGGKGNGAANDDATYVAPDRPIQGQTFRTGDSPEGYVFESVTLRTAKYPENVATGSNGTSWNLHRTNGPIIVTISRVAGDTLQIVSMQNFTAGSVGNPGSGTDAIGPGVYITLHLPHRVHLDPDTTYAFDLDVGNGADNSFEWDGLRGNPYEEGTAYHRSGLKIKPTGGDRVFMVSLNPAAKTPFAHPGTLHSQADLDRMKAKITAGEEPWKSAYDVLLSSPYASKQWPAFRTEYIVRGGSGQNYTRSQQDAQAIYTLALLWHLTGDASYADHAVDIANVWADTLVGIRGNTNASLGAGLCGYLFTVGGELLGTYPGWPDAEKKAYQEMMMRVFYPRIWDFLWRHHDTFWRMGGNTHYRLNWDTCNMAALAAIGVLCDNRAVYEQAVDYFKHGPGNGRVERAAWYIHPDGLAQTEEVGRDQGHNLGGWYSMTLLCQITWSQGDDLWGYDDNRVLRALEYITKFNLGEDVPHVPHRNTSLNHTETLAAGDRGRLGWFHELAYNHYVNERGLAAPYNEAAAAKVRPEPWPDIRNHPSEVDFLGLGTLTFTRDPVPPAATPSALHANWSGGKVVLHWMGTANATGYDIKRSLDADGPFTTIGMVGKMDLYFADPDVRDGTTYYYAVSANTSEGVTNNSNVLAVSQREVTRYSFDGNAGDGIAGRDALLRGGSTGLPGYGPGHGGGQAIELDGIDDYVELPVGVANYQDLTIAAWVYWKGGDPWQRIFDFGSEIEKCMFLTPSNGSHMRCSVTTSRGHEGTGVLEGPPLPTTRWVHIAVTLDGDRGRLYVDGQPVDTEVIDQVDPLFAQVYCYLGRSLYNSDPYFNGRIDDFRIYNYALSDNQVSTLASHAGE